MTTTNTNTSTYTIVDIRKSFEGFNADLRIIARKTGKWSMPYVDKIFHDIIALAEEEYLTSVDIVLLDQNENPVKATKYTINSKGTATNSDRAGRNDWSDLPNTRLSVLLSYANEWERLTDEQKANFQKENDFQIGWTTSKIDNKFPHLTKARAQLYANNGYEVQKENFS